MTGTGKLGNVGLQDANQGNVFKLLRAHPDMLTVCGFTRKKIMFGKGAVQFVCVAHFKDKAVQSWMLFFFPFCYLT